MKNRAKGLLAGIIITAISTGGAVYAKQCTDLSQLVYSNIQLKLNGSNCNLSNSDSTTAQPFILNDRTYLPVRSVCESLGMNVDWDADTNTVQLGDCSNTNTATEAAVESDDVKINLNGNYVDFSNSDGGSTKPCIVNGRTYLPVRAICEALGMNVGWDANSNTVTLDNEGTTNTGSDTGTTTTTDTTTDTTTTTGTTTASEQEMQVLELCNQERANQGLSALTWNDTLASVARAHSQDMSVRNYFSHDNPDGLSPFDRMENAGISYSYAAENIAMGQRTAQEVVTAWMNSSGHRANILNPNLKELGVGMYQSGGSIYWTQDFATLR